MAMLFIEISREITEITLEFMHEFSKAEGYNVSMY